MTYNDSKYQTNRNLILLPSDDYSGEILSALEANGWRILIADSIHEAFDLVSSHDINVGLCLLDKSNNEKRLSQLKELFQYSSAIKWIMGIPKGFLHGNAPTSEESNIISKYCHDYLEFPAKIEQVLCILGHAFGMAQLSSINSEDIGGCFTKFGLIGESPAMQKLYKQIEKVSWEDSTVLIEGETGTGKGLIARAIHNHSHRAEKPLITINCSTLSKDTIQLELFGYEKGAFVGALDRKIGYIESAQQGTLFLDEIDSLPLELQVNLSRFLEENSIMRVGGTKKVPIDVRVIAASRVDLKKAVETGKFHECLYYRLKELPLSIPPLRVRTSDIDLLVEHFFQIFSDRHDCIPKGFSHAAMQVLRKHAWPGNLYELITCVHNTIVMCKNKYIAPQDLILISCVGA
jgi:DNA-binding NtrC family response regulator